MYIRENFQENDMTTSYSGRRIRRAVEKEQESIKREAKKEKQMNLQEETKVKEVQKSEENRYSYLPEVGTDRTKDRLRLMIVNKLANGGNHLIGVFGMNSDTILSEVLQEMRSSGNFIMLRKSYLSMDDVFATFAGIILKYLQGSFLNDERVYGDDWTRNQLFRYLNDICPDETLEELGGFYKIEALSIKLDRGEKCKQLLRFIKEQLRRYDVKFVWNVETDIYNLNYRLLKDLSQIVCDDLIIVVNSLAPLRMEAQHIGAEFEYGDSEHMGHKIIQKFFCGETIYDA